MPTRRTEAEAEARRVAFQRALDGGDEVAQVKARYGVTEREWIVFRKWQRAWQVSQGNASRG